MKSLVVLNECLFSDAQRQRLQQHFSDVSFYGETATTQAAIERIGDHSIAIIDQFVLPFSEEILQACPALELIIVNTTAYDRIDTDMLAGYGVKLSNLAEYATQDVAEVALSMILELNNHSSLAQQSVQGKIADLPAYTSDEPVTDIWPGHPLSPFITRRQLRGQTVGIIGMGKIGKRCAELCTALGMKVIYYNRTPRSHPEWTAVALDGLFQVADVILVTMSYEAGVNDAFIGEDLLASARDDALLISVAHPNLIATDYLLAHPTKFRGIGLDYLVTEPVRRLQAVRKHDLIVTPHLGSQSTEAIHMMTESLIATAERFAGTTA